MIGADAGPAEQAPRRPRRALLGGGVTVVALLAIVAGLLGYRWFAGRGLSSGLEYRMGLNALDGSAAPPFKLVDQNGQSVSLNSLRGRVVVLEFMDPKCTDICPIVSQEYVDAAKLLGPKAADVRFVAINVNQYHESLADVAAFSRDHGLDQLPGWHFLTGSTPQLQASWKAYAVGVTPNPNGDVGHSSLMYFIDQNGRERWLAMPDRNQADIAQWGQDIATVANRLL